MSVRAEAQPHPGTLQLLPQEALAGATAMQQSPPSVAEQGELHEANTYQTASPEHPLSRTVVVTVRASMNDLCLKKSKAQWSPSGDAIRSILQQRKFTDLSGNSEAQGALNSVVLHKLTVASHTNTFPCAVGARITGVDDTTYSITGEAFSQVVAANSATHTSRLLQEDDVSLAYEFARKFPGYTSDNLSEKGIHEVQARRFCLVAADHPLVSAISENAEKLQMGEISMMPEGLVKISSNLYETILPMVKAQVESQIKVKDMSRFNVTLAPADHVSWSAARDALMSEAKHGLRASLDAEMAAVGTDASEETMHELRARFAAKEREIEHDIDHTVHTFTAAYDMSYNFLSQ